MVYIYVYIYCLSYLSENDLYWLKYIVLHILTNLVISCDSKLGIFNNIGNSKRWKSYGKSRIIYHIPYHISCHITSCQITSHHVTLYHVTSHYIMSSHVMPWSCIPTYIHCTLAGTSMLWSHCKHRVVRKL